MTQKELLDAYEYIMAKIVIAARGDLKLVSVGKSHGDHFVNDSLSFECEEGNQISISFTEKKKS